MSISTKSPSCTKHLSGSSIIWVHPSTLLTKSSNFLRPSSNSFLMFFESEAVVPVPAPAPPVLLKVGIHILFLGTNSSKFGQSFLNFREL